MVGALLAPILFPDDPFSIVDRPFVPPLTNSALPLGTDVLGRDMAAMLFHGARVSLAVGFVATAVAMTIGILIGSFAGYYGRFVDDALMRCTEMIQTMPNFLFAMAIVSIVGAKITNVIIAIGAVSWPQIARVVRAEFLTLRERDFVLASRGMGMSNLRIILSEILPNALPPAIVLSSVIVAVSILLEAALAFLGLSDPNVASWGGMIGQGREVLRTAFWMIAIPGFAIILTVLGVSLVGEGLNDALNPHRRPR
jgi:peptide/nickel transport system permease protein